MILVSSGISAENPFGNIPEVDTLPVIQSADEICESDDIEIDFPTTISYLRQVRNDLLMNSANRLYYVPVCIYRNNGNRYLLYWTTDRFCEMLYLASLDSGKEFPPTLCLFTDDFPRTLRYSLTPDNTVTIESMELDSTGQFKGEPKISVYKIDRNFTKVK